MIKKRPRGRPKNPPKFKELMEELMYTHEIFEPDELKMFKGLSDIYLKDFDEEHLTANDMDDILGIAMNKVLELRLLKASRGKTDMQIDTSAAIERLRKQTEKLKENLATRRKDRIDPKKFGGFSIVDIAVAFDMDRKRDLMDKSFEFKKEEVEALKSELLIGNREDEDAEIVKTEEGEK